MGLMVGHRSAAWDGAGQGGLMLAWLCILLVVVGQISCHQETRQTSNQEPAREGLFMVPWHLGRRATPHLVGKRAPAADPGGVSLSVTANMDTLRNRLLWSLQNNHRQIGRTDLHSAG